MFENRLRKVYRHLTKQARNAGITCFRIYDHDLPEFPFIVEWYEGRLYVSEYKRRHGLGEDEHEAWLEGCRDVLSQVLEVPQEQVFFKMRQRKEGRQGQYQRLAEEKNEFLVQENRLKFIVNLSDYLDTGLFLDHRITRQLVREEAKDKRVLNLFCYTGSFSVYAVAGGASKVVSSDLSKTYLDWTVRNVALNFPDYAGHEAAHGDVLAYLPTLADGSFDLIVLDPPTFSNSKRMEGILDVQRDHAGMINQCLRILAPGGTLYFSTNFTRFELDGKNIRVSNTKDITRQTTPFDFPKLKRPCFRFTK